MEVRDGRGKGIGPWEGLRAVGGMVLWRDDQRWRRRPMGKIENSGKGWAPRERWRAAIGEVEGCMRGAGLQER